MKSAQKRPEIKRKINQFLEYMEVERGASPLTIRNYSHYLRRFNDWLIKNKVTEIEEIDQEKIRRFRLFLSRYEDEKKRTLSKKTQSYHVIALRSFLKWLIKRDFDVVAPEKIDLPKISDRKITYLSGEQVDQLLNAPSISTIIGKRDKAILETLFSTGLRVSELVKLDKNKINFDRRELGIVGKGGKARVVFLSSRAAEWIQKYINQRDDHFTPLFIRHKGKITPTTSDSSMRLTPRSVQRLVKKYARKVSIPVEVTPHVIRHSFATDLLMAGADLRSVQEMLGHKNVSTTQIYTHVTDRQLKEIHERFHGKKSF